MNKAKLYMVLALPVFLMACSFGKNTVNVEEVKKIKKVGSFFILLASTRLRQ